MNISQCGFTLSLVSFVISCAPYSAMPPPAHFASEQNTEVGIVAGSGIYYLDVSSPEMFVQGYMYHRFSDKHSVGLKVQDTYEAFNGGVFYRYTMHNNATSYRGIDVDVGAFYLKTSYVTAWRQKNSQIYFSPGLMLHPYGADVISPGFVLPVGGSIWLGDQFSINLELGTSLYKHPADGLFSFIPQSASYGALGLSARF